MNGKKNTFWDTDRINDSASVFMVSPGPTVRFTFVVFWYFWKQWSLLCCKGRIRHIFTMIIVYILLLQHREDVTPIVLLSVHSVSCCSPRLWTLFCMYCSSGPLENACFFVTVLSGYPVKNIFTALQMFTHHGYHGAYVYFCCIFFSLDLMRRRLHCQRCADKNV